MELWIRSQQHTTLIKVNHLHIREDLNDYICIVANENKNNFTLVGQYETKERALEVLDEIQDILAPKYMIRMDENLNNIANFLNIDGTYIKNSNNADVKNINNTYVYVMPQE